VQGPQGIPGRDGEQGPAGPRGERGATGESGLLSAAYPLVYDKPTQHLKLDTRAFERYFSKAGTLNSSGGMGEAFKFVQIASQIGTTAQSGLTAVGYVAETLTFQAGYNVRLLTNPATNTVKIDWHLPTLLVTGSSYTVSLNDYYIGVNCTADCTITLPSGCENGHEVIVKDESGHAGDGIHRAITILGGGTDKIDNKNSAILNISNGALQFLYREGWRII
jgi:hypothetical protein